MPANIEPHDIYVKRTDPSGKHKPVVTHHRVWDAELFMAAQVAQHDGSETKPEDRRLISKATKAEYLANNQH